MINLNSETKIKIKIKKEENKDNAYRGDLRTNWRTVISKVSNPWAFSFARTWKPRDRGVSDGYVGRDVHTMKLEPSGVSVERINVELFSLFFLLPRSVTKSTDPPVDRRPTRRADEQKQREPLGEVQTKHLKKNYSLGRACLFLTPRGRGTRPGSEHGLLPSQRTMNPDATLYVVIMFAGQNPSLPSLCRSENLFLSFLKEMNYIM